MSQRWSRSVLVGVAVASVVLAGCGGSGDDALVVPGGSVRCDGVALAFMGALTGGEPASVPAVADGAQIAVDASNAKHPKCRVELKRFDSGRSPDRAPAGASPAFVSAYRDRFGTEPPAFAAEGYDAANAFLAAIAAGNTTRPAVDVFLDTDAGKGITGTVRWDANGERSGTTVRVVEVDGGAFVARGNVPG